VLQIVKLLLECSTLVLFDAKATKCQHHLHHTYQHVEKLNSDDHNLTVSQANPHGKFNFNAKYVKRRGSTQRGAFLGYKTKI